MIFGHSESCLRVCVCYAPLCYRIVTGNNTNNKSESDQEDNDDVNDNDWSYGAEKKGTSSYLRVGILNIYFCDRMKLNKYEITLI